MSDALMSAESTLPEPPSWLLCDDPRLPMVCVACGYSSDHGFLSTTLDDSDGPPFLCVSCAEDLVTAYVASSQGMALLRREDE